MISEISKDEVCSNLQFHAWYHDDGVLAGPISAVHRALALIKGIGPPLGLFVNMSKCEVYSQSDLSLFPTDMKQSHNPNIEILGIPIGDKDFCSAFISRKRSEARPLLERLEEVGAVDPQVALTLLRMCGGFCRFAHLARATPPSLAMTSLQLFDEDVRRSFSLCTAIDTTDVAWQQAQLSLSRGGLGMRSLSLHSPAAFIASLCSSGYGSPSNHHLSDAIQTFNESVSPSDTIQSDGLVSSSVHQNQLSSKIDIHQFNNILIVSSVADKARLLSVSSPHAASWLTVVPSEGLGLHLEPSVFQVAVKWWLGLDTSNGSLCALCPNSALDPLGHHATTCKKGGDVVTRHNQLRNVLAETCRRAHLSVKVEMGSNLTSEHDHSRPADILLPNWALGKPAAFDISVTSPLNPKIVSVAGLSAGAAALSTEERKHNENDPKCNALGWYCVPLVTESYGAWGKEAMDSFKMLASRLAIISGKPKSVVLSDLYSRLNLHLVRANATAILSRWLPS